MEREDIIKSLDCCSKDDCDNCPNDFGNCYANLAGYALSLIKELTEENERLRAEGEWISNELGGYSYAFYCSECGWVDGYPFNDRHKYCPNCGAKMKGE